MMSDLGSLRVDQIRIFQSNRKFYVTITRNIVGIKGLQLLLDWEPLGVPSWHKSPYYINLKYEIQ
jgi:hypothetical protein